MPTTTSCSSLPQAPIRAYKLAGFDLDARVFYFAGDVDSARQALERAVPDYSFRHVSERPTGR